MEVVDRGSSRPKNLQEIIDGVQSGYRLMKVFSLMFDHCGDQDFRSVYMRTRSVVWATEFEVIQRVWQLMPPAPSKVVERLAYVNLLLGLQAPVSNSPEFCQVEEILTPELFTHLISQQGRPFMWHPTLVLLTPMSEINFLKMIAEASKKYQA
ncbi:MAG: hypothetical protein KBC81_01180 [Candidatus Pacebacteria bacterium]|nr:hypothetical protein [Candidatus Paceibacterota bacterium]